MNGTLMQLQLEGVIVCISDLAVCIADAAILRERPQQRLKSSSRPAEICEGELDAREECLSIREVCSAGRFVDGSRQLAQTCAQQFIFWIELIDDVSAGTAGKLMRLVADVVDLDRKVASDRALKSHVIRFRVRRTASAVRVRIGDTLGGHCGTYGCERIASGVDEVSGVNLRIDERSGRVGRDGSVRQP